jgi:hypothetical protein
MARTKSLIIALLMLTSTLAGCTGSDEVPSELVQDEPVLYLAFTLHLEGWVKEDELESKFDRHVSAIQNATTLFESYGERLNIEVLPGEFINAVKEWNSSILNDLEDAGHVIGIHADIGNTPGTTTESMTNLLRNMRLLGESEGLSIRGVSGICSERDWVKAAHDAGYEYITSIVEFCLLSMNEEDIPTGYEYILDCTTPSECHDVAFWQYPTLSMHPYRPDNSTNWAQINHSSDQPVLFMGATQQRSFHCLSHDDAGDCAYNNGTINAYMDAVETALGNLDSDVLNTMNTVSSLGESVPNELWHALFTALQPYIDSGQVEIVTVGSMFDMYLEWSAEQVSSA